MLGLEEPNGPTGADQGGHVLALVEARNHRVDLEADPELLAPAIEIISLPPRTLHFFFFFITLGLEMSDANVYEPSIRDPFGTPSQCREAYFN